MISVSGSDNLQNLLSNLNIDNGDKKVEKLVLQLGELSARYSDLAARYLKLANSKTNEPPFMSASTDFNDARTNISSFNSELQKSLIEVLSVSSVYKLYLNYFALGVL